MSGQTLWRLGVGLVAFCLVALFWFSAYDINAIHDLQHRVAVLEGNK